jgi:hypothetical protein
LVGQASALLVGFWAIAHVFIELRAINKIAKRQCRSGVCLIINRFHQEKRFLTFSKPGTRLR